MIFPFVFFLVSAFLGYSLTKFLTKSLKKEEMIAAGLLLGSLINIVLNYLLANLFGFSLQMIILSQILLLILSGIFFIYTKENLTTSDTKLRLSLILVVLVSLFIFIPLFISHMLNIKNGDYYTGGFTYGDLAFHTTLINSFVYGENFPPENPVFSGVKLTYAPFMDFLSAMFVITGSSIQQALYIPGIIFASMIAILAFLIAYQLTKKIFVSFLTPLLFIFNGGIGFILFINDMQRDGKDIFTALQTMTKEYAHLQDFNIHFSNVVADYFLPQRTFLLGFSVGILILIFVFKYFENRELGNLLIAGFLSGLLPLIQPHSLIAVGIVISVLVLINFNWSIFLDFAKGFVIIFLLVSTVPIIWIWTAGQVNSEFFRVQLFWMAKEDNPLWFYFKNLGLVLPLIFLAFLVVPKKIIKAYLPFASIFIITNVFIFQPHDYDNMKIMLYWFLVTLILISYLLYAMWQKRSLISRILFCFLLFFLTITGILSVFRESYAIYQMYDKEGLNLAYQVRQITSPGEVILTSDQHNHPITSFAGRPVVMGYRGWLWTWGYDYREREKDVLDIYQGAPDAKKLINKYNISLIVIGPIERSQFLANETYFDSNFRLLLRTNDYKVYDAKSI